MTVLPVTMIRRFVDVLAAEVVGGGGGGGEVERGERRGEHAVGFLGKRRAQVAGAQPGLDVAERNLAIKRGQRGGQDGGRVALGEDHVGLKFGERRVDPLQQPGHQRRERLVRLHHGQVAIDADAEQRDHLLDQLAVLARIDDQRLECRRPAPAQRRPGPS